MSGTKGNIRSGKPELSKDTLLALYRTMVMNRRFEDRVYYLFLEGAMHPHALSRGPSSLGSGGASASSGRAPDRGLSGEPAVSQTDRASVRRGERTNGITARPPAWPGAGAGAMFADRTGPKHQTLRPSGGATPVVGVLAMARPHDALPPECVATTPHHRLAVTRQFELIHPMKENHQFFNSFSRVDPNDES